MVDLVVVSLEPWDDTWRRNQHLVAGLLRDDPQLRVLFVEPAADPTYALTRRARPRIGRGLRRAPALTGVAPGRLWLFEPTKWRPRRLDRRTDDRLADAVLRAARRLGMDTPRLWVNAPSGAGVLARTGWPALYDVTDDWLAADRSPAEHARLEADEALLLERCREVVVCSPGLALTKVHARGPITVVPNAVDLEPYDRPARPPHDLGAGPVALYVGTLHSDRLDLDLCLRTQVSAAELGGRLVMVGPVALDHAERAQLADGGVTLLGPRRFDLVPDYLRAADVLVVPHVVTAFTESLDPIKVYEYAAARRPVVTTPVAGFRDLAEAHVAVVDATTFPEAVAAALRSPPVVTATSRLPSWTDRVRAVREVLDRLG